MSYSAAVITVSDKGYAGERADTSGPAVRAIAEENGFEVKYKSIIPDDMEMIKAELIKCADELKIGLVLTTGGTGFSPRDVTPEATLAVAHRNAPGIAEALRAQSLQITPRAMFSRGASVLRGKTLIVNLPGSPKAVEECLTFLLPHLGHGLEILSGQGDA